MKYKKAFTLPEMVIAVAIIGTVTAIAVPNYLRLRMETNMEMVKQHMRVIGEKMTEIIGKKGIFPDPNDWPNLTADEDEMSLTANLSAIDQLCYTNTDYTVNTGRSTYQFCRVNLFFSWN